MEQLIKPAIVLNGVRTGTDSSFGRVAGVVFPPERPPGRIEYSCRVRCTEVLDKEKKIAGVDGVQALELSVTFLRKLWVNVGISEVSLEFHHLYFDFLAPGDLQDPTMPEVVLWGRKDEADGALRTVKGEVFGPRRDARELLVPRLLAAQGKVVPPHGTLGDGPCHLILRCPEVLSGDRPVFGADGERAMENALTALRSLWARHGIEEIPAPMD